MAKWQRAWRYPERIPEIIRCLLTAPQPLGLILDYLGLRDWRGPRVIEPARGCVLQAETYEDFVTAWIIFYRQEYALPRSATTIVDLGANIGCFTLYAAHRQASARVLAVEPMPATFGRLEQTVSRNLLASRVILRKSGVAASDGIRIIPDADAPSQSLGILPDDASASGTPITCESLGHLITTARAEFGREIDFLKVDIEGAEHEAFGAATRRDLDAVREIAMEYHPNSSKAELFAALDRCGFELVRDRAFNAGSGVAHFRRRT